jgi:hypothetical protein
MKAATGHNPAKQAVRINISKQRRATTRTKENTEHGSKKNKNLQGGKLLQVSYRRSEHAA